MRPHLPAMACGSDTTCLLPRRSPGACTQVRTVLSYIQFLGAAGVVTGSKHLIHVDNDGARGVAGAGRLRTLSGPEGMARAQLAGPAGARRSTIDAVILTHAHLDHSGWIPRLVKQGFHGPIYATAADHRSVRHSAARLRTPAGRRRGVLQQDAGLEAPSRAAALHHGRGAAVPDAVPPGQLRRGQATQPAAFVSLRARRAHSRLGDGGDHVERRTARRRSCSLPATSAACATTRLRRARSCTPVRPKAKTATCW